MIGLIAGSKTLPFLFAREARRRGDKVFAVAFDGETDPALAEAVDDIAWIKVGQLGKMIRALADRKISQTVMLGQIAPKNLFDLRPDLRAMGILLRLKERNAHTLFGAIANELSNDGIELIPAVPWLKPWMPEKGYTIGPILTEDQRSEVSFGMRLAKEISRLEIGQSVVVKKGTVLAVEGFEGTDLCLARGGDLAGKGGGAVAVKVAKKNHDLRFDIPCIGPRTVETCAQHGIRVLAVESGATLLLEQAELEKRSKSLGISVVTADANPSSGA